MAKRRFKKKIVKATPVIAKAVAGETSTVKKSPTELRRPNIINKDYGIIQSGYKMGNTGYRSRYR